MIVCVKNPSKAQPVRGYHALHQAADDDWRPITQHSLPSSDAAIDACVNHLREMVHDIESYVSDRLQTVASNIARLLHSPTKADRVVIQGVACEVDDEGTVSMPALEQKPPRPAIDLVIDDSLYEALCQSMNLEDPKRPEAVETIVDAILNEPLDLLVAVAAAQDDMFDRVTRFMVEVRTRQAGLSHEDIPGSEANRTGGAT